MDVEKYGKLTYRETLFYHDALREELYDAVTQEYARYGIKAKAITHADATEADNWKYKWDKPNRVASWDWKEMYGFYQSRRAARRLDLAISKAGKLLGLCYGMLENNRLILKVHAMEANPKNNPIASKMLEITLYAADIYADINGSSEIWLCDPVSDSHVRLYQSKGFTPYYDRFDKCTHLMRRVR